MQLFINDTRRFYPGHLALFIIRSKHKRGEFRLISVFAERFGVGAPHTRDGRRQRRLFREVHNVYVLCITVRERFDRPTKRIYRQRNDDDNVRLQKGPYVWRHREKAHHRFTLPRGLHADGRTLVRVLYTSRQNPKNVDRQVIRASIFETV